MGAVSLTGKGQEIIQRLRREFPNPGSELIFRGEYQLLVSVVLSAQCTDKKVNEVTPALFARWGSFPELSEATLSELEGIIRPVNYYKTKARNLIAGAKVITAQFAGKVPLTFAELLTVPGVGQKTASVVLGEIGAAHTFPVDTHVFRVSKRLGFAKGKSPKVVEEELKAYFPKRLWRNIHHWLILHGRRTCKAQRPLCETCPLRELCPSASRS